MISGQREAAPMNFSVDGDRMVAQYASVNAYSAGTTALERRNELQICSSHSQQVYNASRQRAHQSRAELRAARRAENRRRQQFRSRQRRLTAHSPRSMEMLGFAYDSSIDYETTISIGTMSITCNFCMAMRFTGESEGICCKQGKVRLEPFQPPPEPLNTLFSGTYPESNKFLRNIRKYNSCFSMTSSGTSAATTLPTSFNYTFRIQGQIYHKIGSMLPERESDHTYIQVYFMGDPDAQVDRRCDIFQDCKRNIVAVFQQLFDQHNHLIKTFRTAMEALPSEEHSIVVCNDRTPVGEHVRRFNGGPTVNEVSMAIVIDRNSVPNRNGGALERIYETHPAYDALQYPLILWRGNSTYHFDLRQVDPRTGLETSKKVSA